MQFKAISNSLLPMHHYMIWWEVFQRCVQSPLNALMRTMKTNSWQICPLLLLNNEILQYAINFYIAINVAKDVPFYNLQSKINSMQSTCKIYCKNIWRKQSVYNNKLLVRNPCICLLVRQMINSFKKIFIIRVSLSAHSCNIMKQKYYQCKSTSNVLLLNYKRRKSN